MSKPSPAHERFLSSMIMDHEKWHDGIGYDLEALREMSAAELTEIVKRLSAGCDWRDVEALAVIVSLDSISADAAKQAKSALKKLAKSNNQAGLRAAEALADLGESDGVEDKVVKTLLRMGDDSAFSDALDLCEDLRGDRIKMALLKCARDHDSQGVHCAAMLYYHAGIAKEAFDWDHRPFFLRFNPDDPEDRAKAFVELCAKVGVDPKEVK
jgi:hypothetical protein